MFWVDKKLLKPRIGECSEAEDTAPVVGYADAVFGKEDVLHAPAGGRLVVGTTQLERVALRWQQSPNETFSMSDVMLDACRVQFDMPDAGELAGAHPERPPAGWPDWLAGAADRWPSFIIS